MDNDNVIRSIICLFAMDGEISKQEMQFLQEMRKRLGVSHDIVKSTFEQVQQGKGKIYLSEDPAELKRIFEVLVRAAVADGKIDPQEHKVLDAVAAKTGVSRREAEMYINNKLQQMLAAKPIPSKSSKLQTMACPKCGFEQQTGRADCMRCGVVFQRFEKHQTEILSQDVDDPESTVPNVYRSWLHKSADSEQELESSQQRMREYASNVNKTLAILGAIGGLIISGLFFWFGISGVNAYLKNSREKQALSNTNVNSVIKTQATIISGDCTTRSRGRYHCYVDYTFEAFLSDGTQKTFIKTKEFVETNWYSQRRLSENVPIDYLASNPEVSHTRGWRSLHQSAFISSLGILIMAIVATVGSVWMLVKNVRKEFSPYEKSKVQVEVHRNRMRFR